MALPVLIPSEQGNVSNKVINSLFDDYRSLNPFGTGKCFKQQEMAIMRGARGS